MTYPIRLQGFEGGTTLGSACPELVDIDSAFAIDSTGSHANTGTNSLKLVTLASSHTILSNINDTLSGDVTISCYFNCGSFNAAMSLFAQASPSGAAPNTYQRAQFSTSGLTLIQDIAATITNLNSPISGVSVPTGVQLCMELRCHGTAVTARVVRQDFGQFFVHSGTGSWSSTPQGVSGTATLTESAGAFGLRLGDGIFGYADDLIIDPAVPSIDNPTFSLSGVGSAQQLTAGGFTDPRFGWSTGLIPGTTQVTWLSSNAGVATVNSSGTVIAVGTGTATITATGKRDTGQTATAVVTVTTTGATSFTLIAPSPASGYAQNASQNFSVQPNGNYTGSITVTPSGGGLSTPIVLNYSASSASQAFQITPTSAGTVTLTPTNSGSLTNPSPVTYTSNAQTLGVNPISFYSALPVTATLTGQGTRWTFSSPTVSITGAGAAGTTLGSVTVVSDTSATVLVTPGPTVGSLVFHDSTTPATASATVAATPTTWSYLSTVATFASGLTGSVFYTVLKSDGTIFAARSSAGVFSFSVSGGTSAAYGALVSLPMSGSYIILWDDSAGNGAFEVFNPTGVEPPSAALPGGLNQSQALSLLVCDATGLIAGYNGAFPATISAKAPDHTTTRISGGVDGLGNRVLPLTLSPPL